MALCDTDLNPRGRLVSMFDMTDCSYANMDVAAMHMILVRTGGSGLWLSAVAKACSRPTVVFSCTKYDAAGFFPWCVTVCIAAVR